MSHEHKTDINIPTETDVIRQLYAIYNALPKIECKGLCHTDCGLVDVMPIEDFNVKMFNRINGFPQKHFLNTSNQKVIRHYKNKHTDENDGCVTCPYLTEDKKCSIYHARPLICRLYGVAQRLQCPHGCVPERLLNDAEAMTFIKIVKELVEE